MSENDVKIIYDPMERNLAFLTNKYCFYTTKLLFSEDYFLVVHYNPENVKQEKDESDQAKVVEIEISRLEDL